MDEDGHQQDDARDGPTAPDCQKGEIVQLDDCGGGGQGQRKGEQGRFFTPQPVALADQDAGRQGLVAVENGGGKREPRPARVGVVRRDGEQQPRVVAEQGQCRIACQGKRPEQGGCCGKTHAGPMVQEGPCQKGGYGHQQKTDAVHQLAEGDKLCVVTDGAVEIGVDRHAACFKHQQGEDAHHGGNKMPVCGNALVQLQDRHDNGGKQRETHENIDVNRGQVRHGVCACYAYGATAVAVAREWRCAAKGCRGGGLVLL